MNKECKWKILNQLEANLRHITIIKIDNNKEVLSADVAFIPKDLTPEEYVEWLKSNDIIEQITID